MEREPEKATVVFADLSGFTAMTEARDLEDVYSIVRGCLHLLDGVVVAHDGVVEKYIGDCLMAVFRGAQTEDFGAGDAVRATIEMRGVVDRYNAHEGLAPPLDVHIGVHTGAVIPSQDSGATVTGEAVSIASELEDLSPKGHIYVGPETHRLTRDEFRYRALAPIEVEGSEAPIAIFDLHVGPLTTEDVARARPTLHERRKSLEPADDSDRRRVAVLFAEITGLSRTHEGTGTQEMQQILSGCGEVAAEAARRYGGTPDRRLGQSLMIVFGAPVAIENAPKAAINAAIEMRRRVRRYAQERGFGQALDIRIGINSGDVIAAEIRSEIARGVVGDHVNVAARLRELAPPGGVYVGLETYRRTSQEFDYRSLGGLKLRGRRRAVAVYELLSEKERIYRETPPAGRRLFSPLVGRDAEFERLRRCAAELGAGRGAVVSIIGDAGIGKSRLLIEATESLELQGVRCLQGRSLSVGRNMSFHPFADLLRGWAGINEEDAEGIAVDKLQTSIRELFEDPNADAFPFIASLMGLTVPPPHDARLQGIEGEARENLILRSVKELLQRLAEREPIALLFEDLHWADLSSIELIDSVMRLVRTHRILVIQVLRPGYAETGDRSLDSVRKGLAPLHVEIQLKPLGRRDTQTLLRNLFRGGELPHELRVQIEEKAKGNPFYVEEVVRSLIDQGAITLEQEGLQATDQLESVVIPETIHEVVLGRVDRLDPKSRYVVQVGSVIGGSFHYHVLTEIVGKTPEVNKALDRLTELQLLTRQIPRHDTQYSFQHPLIQEVTYDSILRVQRERLHLETARAIESILTERAPGFLAMLAYHFSLGREYERAEEYLFRAGEEAAKAAASNEALNFFRDAAKLYFDIHGEGGDPSKKALLEKNIGIALFNRGQLTEAWPHFNRALGLMGERVAEGKVDFALRAIRAALSVGLVLYRPRLWKRRRPAPSDREQEILNLMYYRARSQPTSAPARFLVDSMDTLQRVSQSDPTLVEQAGARYSTGVGLFSFGGLSFDIARRFLSVAEPLVNRSDPAELLLYRLMNFTHHILEGDWSDAHDIDRELLERNLADGAIWDVQTYLGLEAQKHLYRGDFAAAEHRIEWLRQIEELYEYETAKGNRMALTAFLHLERRELEQTVEAAEVYYAEHAERQWHVTAFGTMARAQVHAGDLDSAEANLRRAEDVLRESGRMAPYYFSNYCRSRLAFQLSKLEAALSEGAQREAYDWIRQGRHSVKEAIRTAGKVAWRRTEVYRLVGLYYWLGGNRAEALRWWRRSIEEGRRLGTRPELGRTYLEVHCRCRREDAAASKALGLDSAACLERARQIFLDLDLHWDLARLEAQARAA